MDEKTESILSKLQSTFHELESIMQEQIDYYKKNYEDTVLFLRTRGYEVCVWCGKPFDQEDDVTKRYCSKHCLEAHLADTEEAAATGN